MAGSGNVRGASGILEGISDEELAAQIVDIIRGIAGWQVGIEETTGQSSGGEGAVKDINEAAVEVGGIEEIAAAVVRISQAGVNRRGRGFRRGLYSDHSCV